MKRILNAAVFYLVVLILPVVWAAQAKQVPAAPIPAQILAAKRVFIANAGGDERSFEDPIFNGGPDRCYNQFYAAVKGAGRYELVGSPAEADLTFEIQFLLPTAEPYANRGESLATVAFDPQFRLVIRDPKTNALLWGFAEHVQWAILQSNRDKNFDQALSRIISDLQAIAGSPKTAASSANP